MRRFVTNIDWARLTRGILGTYVYVASRRFACACRSSSLNGARLRGEALPWWTGLTPGFAGSAGAEVAQIYYADCQITR